MKKVERKEIHLPPGRACQICRNRMGDVCLSICAPAGDYRYFEPKMDEPIFLFPNLSFVEYMELPGSMKGKWLFVQQTKILETLYERESYEIGTYIDGNRGGTIFETVQIKSLLHDPKKTDAPHSDRTERKSQGERPPNDVTELSNSSDGESYDDGS